MPKIRYSPTLETTLAIIKPDFMSQRKSIQREMIGRGFHILMKRTILFTPEQAAEFYKDYEKTKWFMLMVLYLTKGVSEAFILSKENAVLDFLAMLKQDYSECNTRCICKECMKSMICDFEVFSKYPIHASTSISTARAEINMVFPNFIVEPILARETGNLCFEKRIIKPIIEALHCVTEDLVEDPVTAVADYLQTHNPSLPSIIENVPGVGEKMLAQLAEMQSKQLQVELPSSEAKSSDSSKSSTTTEDTPTSTSSKSAGVSSSLTLITSSGSATTSTCQTEDSDQKKDDRVIGVDGLLQRDLFSCKKCEKIIL